MYFYMQISTIIEQSGVILFDVMLNYLINRYEVNSNVASECKFDESFSIVIHYVPMI